jgi:hypothetical protein
MCRDDRWLEVNSRSSIGKILFKNGYYDSENTSLSTGSTPDCVLLTASSTIMRKWTTAIASTCRVSKKLFYAPLGEPTGDYLIQGFARALFGEHTKRIFFIQARQIAATMITRALMNAVGEYCAPSTPKTWPSIPRLVPTKQPRCVG